MPSGFRFALIALLVSLTATAGVAAQASGQAQAQPQPDASLAAESTTLEVSLQPDGDARWSVSATYDLATPEQADTFRTVADRFRRDETAQLGLSAFRTAARTSGAATGREMAITDVERSASPAAAIENGTGRLTLSFTWTNFGRVEDDRLVVGDVLTAGGGTWLRHLGSNQTLVLRPPSGYAVLSASSDAPAPQNGTLVWEGPTTFGADGFTVTFTGEAGGPAGPGGDGGSALWLVIATLALGALVFVAVRRRDAAISTILEAPRPDGEDGERDEQSSKASQTGASPEGEAGGEDGEGSESDEDDGIDEELLSDEERVERLLERNGGRMKQATIVKETGWSNAKVSQLLSSMDEAGRIDKLRIGRENLISLPDEDVTDLDSER
jgi:uncharacterized membrane protein